MLKRMEKVKVEKLDRRLESVAEALEETGSEGWRKALGERLAKRGKALKGAIAEAGQIYSPERLHQVRMQTKKLRYGLEMAEEAGSAPRLPPVRQLRKVQDALGRLPACRCSRTTSRRSRRSRRRGRCPERGLAAVAGALEDQCRHLHGRYVSLAPGGRRDRARPAGSHGDGPDLEPA